MRIGVAGCAGRMGRMLVRTVMEEAGATLAAGSERADHPDQGRDLAALVGAEPVGVSVTADSETMFRTVDAVIDFTTPRLAGEHARLAARHGVHLVVGTTGLGEDDEAALDEAANRVAVVQAANMSIGVNLLLALTQQVAAALGQTFDIEIVEMHHRHKVDAPSGTALALGRAAAHGRRVELAAKAVRVRDGVTRERPAGAIGFAALRGGDVVGEHTVIFAGDGERIELTHKAASRLIFARGAVRAALWTRDRAPGRYTMREVLGTEQALGAVNSRPR